MICRLCLNATEFYLKLENAEMQEGEEDEDIAKVVATHFDVPLDTSSDVICNVCWQQIIEFHKFYLFIVEKQKELTQLDVLIDLTAAESDTETEDVVDITNESLTSVNTPMETHNILSQGYEEERETEHLEEAQNLDRLDQVEVVPSTCAINANKLSNYVAPTTRTLQTKIIHKVIQKSSGHQNLHTNNQRETNGVGILKCDLCGQPLENFAKLRIHFRDKHQRHGYAVCCNKRYLSRESYVEHWEWHLNPNKFKCEKCNLICSSRSTYEIHVKLKCPMSYLNKAKKTQQNTMKVHYKCNKCSMRFERIDGIRAHQINVHQRIIGGKNLVAKAFVTKVQKATDQQSNQQT